MARYVILIRFTDRGSAGIDKSAARGVAFKKAAEKAGVTVEAQLWTLGSCDGVLILNGDEQAVLRLVTELASRGNVRIETLTAFDAREFSAIAG